MGYTVNRQAPLLKEWFVCQNKEKRPGANVFMTPPSFFTNSYQGKKFSLDIRSPYALSPEFPCRKRETPMFPSVSGNKSLDGLQNRRSFIAQLQEQALGDSLKRFWRKCQIRLRRVRRLFARIAHVVGP